MWLWKKNSFLNSWFAYLSNEGKNTKAAEFFGGLNELALGGHWDCLLTEVIWSLSRLLSLAFFSHPPPSSTLPLPAILTWQNWDSSGLSLHYYSSTTILYISTKDRGQNNLRKQFPGNHSNSSFGTSERPQVPFWWLLLYHTLKNDSDVLFWTRVPQLGSSPQGLGEGGGGGGGRGAGRWRVRGWPACGNVRCATCSSAGSALGREGLDPGRRQGPGQEALVAHSPVCLSNITLWTFLWTKPRTPERPAAVLPGFSHLLRWKLVMEKKPGVTKAALWTQESIKTGNWASLQ